MVIFLFPLFKFSKTSSKLKKFRNIDCNKNEKSKFFKNLEKIGYNTQNKKLVILAFQRRFRQELVNGIIDKECLKISENLLKKRI